MPRTRPPGRLAATAALATSALLVAGVASAYAAPTSPNHPGNPLSGVAKLQVRQHAHPRLSPAAISASGSDRQQEGGGDALEVADQAEQYSWERSAPTDSVSARMLLKARREARQLPVAKAFVREITARPYDAEPAGYTDPYWSNAGSGFRDVSGRTTALAVDGNTYYAGTADGGVWKSTNAGKTWHSIWDNMPTLSIGALLVTPDHALWVGTGEANTNSDSYLGTGVYRSTNGGKSFKRVGGSELIDHQSYRLVRDGHGHVYAATSRGLYRHPSNTNKGKWSLVLKPDPNPTGSPYLTSMITDVVVRPGTDGQEVFAVDGWRNGSSYNGFYLSTTGGGAGSFSKITPTGDLDGTDIGRTTLAYASDGSKLYAIIESPAELAAGGDTNLKGVYASENGDPAGPWTQIADSTKLGASGSAIGSYPGYHVGVQSWYNQALAVDPKNADHVYVSLEEVFETTNGGSTFTTASPYWNYGLACGASCPPVTHPDQHALAIAPGRQVVIGNDGGVYKRAMKYKGYGHWKDLNDTLYTLQYYDAAAGRTGGGLAYWGGMQDNGTGVVNPGAKKQIEPAGGDGGMVFVNPRNGKQAVGEYTNLIMYKTTDGGHTFTTISPLCGYYNGSDCDESARFIAPFTADIHNAHHWVAVGNKVWESRKGFNTTCADTSCDWKPVYDLGTDSAGGLNVGTAVATSGVVSYVAHVDSSGNPSDSFHAGIATNVGGNGWHEIQMDELPNRYIQGLTIDPNNPRHVYAIFNGYSRRWIPGGGIGTIFQSYNGGRTWSNLTGNLPNAPGDGLAIVGNKLVLGTDVGLFVANRAHPKRWSRVDGIPNVVVNNVRTDPAGKTAILGTHGRGIWRVNIK